MKQSPRPRKTPSGLAESVNQRLNMYALAANAAGVSLLALSQPAEAKIVYTPIHHVIHANQSFNLDLNHDGKTDFTIVNGYGCTTDLCRLSLSITGKYGLVEGNAGFLGTPFAYALDAGARIGPKSPLFGRIMYNNSNGGQWANVTRRYLGLMFQVKGITHYGWARLNVSIETGGAVATLTGYAYETTPNKPIVAGKTKGPDETDKSVEPANPAALAIPTPKPATLGALAIGAPGLSIWRRAAQPATMQ
jgi:hypothetical protein